MLLNGSDNEARSQLQPIASLLSVGMKHLHGIQRVFVQVFSDKGELLQNVMSHDDDVAADLMRLKHIKKLARAGPDQFLVGILSHRADSLAH